MIREQTIYTTVIVALAGLLPLEAIADQEEDARRACKARIAEVYDLDKFRNTWTDKLGNHKFQVHGEVRFDHNYYDFQCKVKQGEVRSYAYEGPHRKHGDHSDDMGKAVAVGAGLAIAAALVAASNDGDDRNLSASKSVLEDDCHDILQYRIRDEHDRSADVQMEESTLKGRDLSGEAKVKYQNRSPHHATFTCHFDRNGRIDDSSYRLH